MMEFSLPPLDCIAWTCKSAWQNRLAYFPIDLLLPAPGQGALGLEIRDEPEWRELLAPLHDPAVQAATGAERMFMRHLGAGCYLPVAAYGEMIDGMLVLRGLVTSLDGQRRIRVSQQMPWTPRPVSNMLSSLAS